MQSGAMEMTRSAIVVGLFLTVATIIPATAGPGEKPGHSHGPFSAGEPGNPKKPARNVQITMGERDGQMYFNHSHVTVRRGEQIRFVLINHGELDHEFVLATVDENVKHAKEMEKNPDMEHDDPNGKRLTPKKIGEIFWRFTEAGEFEFACLIPGHREAGMIGIVVVK